MRLGDDIDDHCSRCKRTTDHSVVSMMGDDVLKTRCRTCGAEHKFKNNKSRTKEMTAKDAFDTLLASANAQLGEEKPGKKKNKATTKDTKGH
jgi:recombinational DNA repair protein (RecF pathway)